MAVERKQFPPSYIDEGGVSVPFIPDEITMENCDFAKGVGKQCPRKAGDIALFSGRRELTNCGTCSLHPMNKAFTEKRFFVKK